MSFQVYRRSALAPQISATANQWIAMFQCVRLVAPNHGSKVILFLHVLDMGPVLFHLDKIQAFHDTVINFHVC
jgi:hypothetical protein